MGVVNSTEETRKFKRDANVHSARDTQMNKRILTRRSIVIIFAFFPMILSSIPSDAGILPTPKFFRERNGRVNFRIAVLNFHGEANDTAAVSELVSYFGKDARRGSKNVRDGILISGRLFGGETEAPNRFSVAIADTVFASEEGYLIESGDRTVTISAKTRTGIFYGVTTLLQLLEKRKGEYYLPDAFVADYPSMKMRGISDDISRGQISTTANFRKIIRFLALHKMNVYMPYIENEFDFKSYPAFSEGRAPLTAGEVAGLNRYATMYHVQLIPIFETLGHLEDVLIKDDFSKYAEFPGSACINVSFDSTYMFMKGLLTEIASAFPNEYFNMAADETWDVGLGASRKLVDSLGLANAHAQHYKKIYDILKSLGKKVMMYGDIILNNPEILDSIPKDITIVDWHYGPSFDYPSIQKFKKAGFEFIASPAVWNFVGPFPNFPASYANIQFFAREAYQENALGMVVSTWNDNGGAELRELNYPGYAWSSECAWNPAGASVDTFENEFFEDYFRTRSDLPRIIYELLSSNNNLVDWNEFWRAPFLSAGNGQAALRTESILSNMPEVFSLISRAKGEVKANADILDIYQLVATMDEFYARRNIGVIKMREISADTLLTTEEKAASINSIEQDLLKSLHGMDKEYRKIYLRTNRLPMLQLLQMRFDDEENALSSGARELASGNSSYDQKLKSGFIYYPGSRPYSRQSSKVDSCTFWKTVEIDSLPARVVAQLIGDTYCKLFVNDQYVGKVEARRTLTLDVERQRVQVFDLAKYLKAGRNTLVIQSANYDRNGSAGCNLMAVIGNDTLSSDSTWMVTKSVVNPSKLDSTTSMNATVYDNGWTVSAPDFSLKLKSWIER